MWLLNTKTLQLRYFNSPRDVAYAILSHVWEDSDKEYNFQSIKGTYEQYRNSKEGAMAHAPDKICKFCLLAADEGFEWAWLDTACIDKTSSAELSEAINSMYAWYEAADLCYAYLYDVTNDDNPFEPDSEFRKSRYHERGWTLQELLASKHVIFLSALWSLVGTKTSLLTPLAERTGIDGDILLRNKSSETASVAQRMSWAARRVTTRAEDRAYSLMGIFGVAMPIIYGEGGERAFLRLQKEIIATCPDQSIFAWGSIHPDFDTAYDAIQQAQTFPYAGGGVDDADAVESLVAETDCSLLAKSPSHFANCAGMRRIDPHRFFELSGHTVDHRCTFSADAVTLYLPVSSHSMHLRDYTSKSVEEVRVVRAVALACTTTSGTSDPSSIVLLFLSVSPNSLDRWKGLSQELSSNAVGLLAAGNPAGPEPERGASEIRLWKNKGEDARWGIFYRGATLDLGGIREPSNLDQQPAAAMLDLFRSVRTDFHGRELRIEHPAARIVTFYHYDYHKLLVTIIPGPLIPSFIVEIPDWVFHRLASRYGFIFSPSPDVHRTIHHALRVTRSLRNTFYLIFVNSEAHPNFPSPPTTLGIAIGAPCCDQCRPPDVPQDPVSLQVFLAPGVLHHDDTSNLEEALRAYELLPKDRRARCIHRRAHLQGVVFEDGRLDTGSDVGGKSTHFAFPIGFADDVARSVVHIWYAGSLHYLESDDTFTRVYNISIDIGRL